ncbi:MAG: ABC transporter permease [Pseudomonadota bacterium]
MSPDLIVLLTGLFAAGIRLATPIALAALGEVVAQRSGVLNVGLEGILLVGAFLAVLFAVWSGSPWVGLLAAIVGGTLMGLIHAFFVVILRTDQIVTGIALIFLGLGVSGYGFRLTLGAESGAVAVPGFQRLNIPGLSDLPVVGPILFSQHALVYIAVAMAIAIAFVLTRTRAGLMIRAAGENPHAAAALGVSVSRVRIACVAFGGACAGMGGAFLSTAQLTGFVEDMAAGRGFIAIACVVFARWSPLGVLLVAGVFGVADAAQIRLQPFFPNLPYQAFVVLPYVLAILALIFASRSLRLPAALGKSDD